MKEYNPNKRNQDPGYLICNAQYLKDFAINQENSSLIIYTCLDLRTALELTEFYFLLDSVGPEFRTEITIMAKSKNGIDKVNRKLKSLKDKFQKFYTAVCEVTGTKGEYFNFKKSHDFQFHLSQYLHTYTRDQADIDFNSKFMQNALPLIDEVTQFIKDSLMFDGKTYTIQNIDVNGIPSEDIEVLNEWKTNSKMTYEEMKSKLEHNLNKRNT